MSAQDAAPAAAPLAAGASEQGLAQVRLRLAAVAEERAHTTRLLPWLTVGVGAAAVLAASGTGAGYALACASRCETPNWIRLAVVAGATVATLGAIWVVSRDADIRELESQRYQLEQELLRLRLSQPLHAAAFGGGRPAFTVQLHW